MSFAHHQCAIDAALRRLGGYWPTLAGLARILEELGELASERGPAARRLEAADCTVATLAVANQYCVPLVSRPPDPDVSGERRALIAGGQLARLVNRIEGSKPPKPDEPGMPTLPEIVGDLVAGLAESSETSVTELVALATAAAEANSKRDAGRFVARVDAVTAPNRDLYWSGPEARSVPLTPLVGLWGVYGGRATWRGQCERFLRLDAIHPLAGLVFGPIDHEADRTRVIAEIAAWGTSDRVEPSAGTSCLVLRGSARARSA